MRTKMLLAAVAAGLFMGGVWGCNVRIDEDGHDDDEEQLLDLEERAAASCDPYCLTLINCGVLSGSAFRACQDLCVEEFRADEDRTAAGCSCVESAQCSERAASQCDGDPVPGVWRDPAGGSGAGGAGSGAGGAGSGGASGAGVGGASGAGSCAASCQCDVGEACIEGQCQVPTGPVESCETDCDCTSGQSCVDGQCE